MTTDPRAALSAVWSLGALPPEALSEIRLTGRALCLDGDSHAIAPSNRWRSGA
jgi:hypothetical protein